MKTAKQQAIEDFLDQLAVLKGWDCFPLNQYNDVKIILEAEGEQLECSYAEIVSVLSSEDA